MEIDDKLNFNQNVSNICKSATNQLSAKKRLKNYLSFDARKLLIKLCYVLIHLLPANFDVLFCTKSLKNLKIYKKRALQFSIHDYVSAYEPLLDKIGRSFIRLIDYKFYVQNFIKRWLILTLFYKRTFCITRNREENDKKQLYRYVNIIK